MTPTIPSASEQAWAMIEQEKRRDRFLRRVSFAAWAMTFLLVVFLAVISIWQTIEMTSMMRNLGGGILPISAFFGAMYPLLIVLGVLSVLVATLSTVGMFLRQRTASLAEIQLRLASLEELLTRKAQE